MNKIKMLFVSLLFPFFANGQDIKNPLVIFGLNDIYQSNDSIVFNIYNQSDTTIVFSIGVQEKTSDKWVEISQDVFQSEFSKTITCLALRTKDSKKITWNTLLIPRVGLNNEDNIKKPFCGRFRFVISYADYDNSMQMYTREFSIVNCGNE
ncbi:MAG TPA: hypothetical protein PLW70_04455 [Bacteroidales bacterium]|nr:hypothetical protein [Bacteroidales bacterium]